MGVNTGWGKKLTISFLLSFNILKNQQIHARMERGAKAHCRQAKANSLRCSFPGSAWERVLGGSAACSFRRWQSHLGKRSQAEPGNEQDTIH